MGWSCLSGISVADVSQISVINLLVSPLEIWNGQHYDVVDDGSKSSSKDLTAEGSHLVYSSSASDPSLIKSKSITTLDSNQLSRQQDLTRLDSTGILLLGTDVGVYS